MPEPWMLADLRRQHRDFALHNGFGEAHNRRPQRVSIRDLAHRSVRRKTQMALRNLAHSWRSN